MWRKSSFVFSSLCLLLLVSVSGCGSIPCGSGNKVCTADGTVVPGLFVYEDKEISDYLASVGITTGHIGEVQRNSSGTCLYLHVTSSDPKKNVEVYMARPHEKPTPLRSDGVFFDENEQPVVWQSPREGGGKGLYVHDGEKLPLEVGGVRVAPGGLYFMQEATIISKSDSPALPLAHAPFAGNAIFIPTRGSISLVDRSTTKSSITCTSSDRDRSR